MKVLLLLGVVLLAGCAVGPMIGLVAVSASVHGSGEAEGRQPPEMAPDRKVSEQDCSKPVDFSLGNIRCK